MSGHSELTLPSGEIVLFDQEDELVVRSYRWRAVPHPRTTYVASGSRSVYLHRVLMAPPPGHVVHHVNGNGLDNRRVNLRVISQSLNIANKRRVSNATGYRGVYLRKKDGRFVAEIKVDGRKKHLGSWANPWAAAQAYNAAATEAWGDMAVLNVKRPNQEGPDDGVGCPGTVT